MRISDWSSDVCSSDLVQSSSQLHQPASQLRSCLLRQHDIACRPCAQQRTWPISSFFNAYAQNKWPGQMPPRGKPVRYWIASGLSTPLARSGGIFLAQPHQDAPCPSHRSTAVIVTTERAVDINMVPDVTLPSRA